MDKQHFIETLRYETRRLENMDDTEREWRNVGSVMQDLAAAAHKRVGVLSKQGAYTCACVGGGEVAGEMPCGEVLCKAEVKKG